MILLIILILLVTISGIILAIYSIKRNLKAKQEIIKLNKEMEKFHDMRKQVKEDMNHDKRNN